MPNSSGSSTDPIIALEPALRRVASLRLGDPADIDDIVQETLTRLIAARSRLDLETLGSYALVTARNLVVSLEREREVAARHAPRLLDPRAPADPEELAIRAEERDAVALALSKLREEDASGLVRHDALEEPLSHLAEERGATTGATATRLTRARARLRVEYLLSYRPREGLRNALGKGTREV